MNIFDMYLYEIIKGSKPAALVTVSCDDIEKMCEKLKHYNLCFHIQNISKEKANLFFGTKYPLDVIKDIIKKPLDKLSDYEDFILGVLLGYSIDVQCKRYLDKIKNSALI